MQTAIESVIPNKNSEGKTFDEVFKYHEGDLIKISLYETMYLHVGDVALVRSLNVPELGDHYIIVKGAPVMKAHGLRPDNFTVLSSHAAHPALDEYDVTENGVVVLKLTHTAQVAFLKFHNFAVVNRQLLSTKSQLV